MRDAVRYSGTLTLRCQPEVSALIDQASRAKGQKPSEYVRQSVIAALQRDGADPALVARSKSAGELYDRLSDGKTRWALVVDGQLVTMSYLDTKPDDGRAWLPVVHEDSEPFDAVKHWRLKPEARLDGDRVVVTFPVVEKNWETA